MKDIKRDLLYDREGDLKLKTIINYDLLNFSSLLRNYYLTVI